MLPVRAGTSFLPWQDPREAARPLCRASLRLRSTHTYQSRGGVSPARSVSAETAARCDDGSFVRNKEVGAPVTHLVDDPAGAARHIARRRQQEPSRSPIDSVCESTA